MPLFVLVVVAYAYHCLLVLFLQSLLPVVREVVFGARATPVTKAVKKADAHHH